MAKWNGVSCLRLLLALCAGLAIGIGICRAQEATTGSWQKLIDSGDKGAARSLCSGWLKSPDTKVQTEAHKCLANVALLGNGVVVLQRNDIGGGYMGSGYKPEAVDAALVHLNEALKLSPQDLSVHQGRLHVLEVSNRYEEMAKALDESCSTYHGQDSLEDWLPYISELFDSGQLRAAEGLLKVLDRHYPNNHEVIGDFGAVYSMLKEDDKAIQYLQRAVELAPNDPIDTWNLGRLYDFTGNTKLADQWYQKSLSLEPEPEQRKQNLCLYGEFVEKKLMDLKRACELEKANCKVGEQSACTSGQ
ncbi:MAG TPA: tetratricopeptide repeat protein [Dongiaceae bacterium]|nr:tetratricopeptide repeat protein [Dongiaceae bacterium]